MKHLALLRNCAIALSLCAGFTACSDDDDPTDPTVPETPVEHDVTLDVASGNFQYRPQGFWDNVYTNDPLVINGIKFSHFGGGNDYGGVIYYSWYGFCPSKSTDNADITGSDTEQWIDHQWGAMPKGGVAGEGTPYLVAYWDYYNESQAKAPTLTVSMDNGAEFQPKEVYVTNTAWSYYGMKNGIAPGHAFTATDNCILHIYGIKDGAETGHIQFYLAKGTDIVDTWEKVDLSILGTVDQFYFNMTSTDSGIFGLNNPAYFAIDGLAIDLN